jgi:para-nitrobenzyl esterase
VDGAVLPDPRYVDRNTNDVPVLTGLTADEGSSMSATYGEATPATLKATLARRYGTLAPAFAKLYPATAPAVAGAAAKQLERDRGLASTWLWAQGRLASSRQPVYLYYFTHVEPGPEAARYGAFHSSDIPYVFATLDRSPGRSFSNADRALSDTLGGYWANWIKTGDPNGAGLPAWPRADANDDAPAMLEIGVHPRASPILPPEKLSLFRSVAAGGGRLGLFPED